MKYFLMLVILTAAVFSFSGCATTDTTTATAKGDPVPGETKSAEESRLQPGAGTGPNASVKW